jgi:flavin reductase (DIM6/NTAB) family NADH-FMN oxidoreductase RutF
MNGHAIAPEDFRAAMGSFAAGVTVITTLDASGHGDCLLIGLA